MKPSHLEQAHNVLLLMIVAIAVALWLLGCQGVSAGDMIPDRWDFHLFRNQGGVSADRPGLDGLETDGWTIGTSVGFDLTRQDSVDIRPLVERLDEIRGHSAIVAEAAAEPPGEPPPADDGSPEAWLVGGGGCALLAALAELMRRTRPVDRG